MTPNFTYNEFVKSTTATKNKIDNNPTSLGIISRLTMLAVLMEQVRSVCGDNPISISSAYRSEELNKAVGGVIGSDHVSGYAVDFTVRGQEVFDTVELIKNSPLQFDQLINERNKWVHISFAPELSRQVMTLKGKGYVSDNHGP